VVIDKVRCVKLSASGTIRFLLSNPSRAPENFCACGGPLISRRDLRSLHVRCLHQFRRGRPHTAATVYSLKGLAQEPILALLSSPIVRRRMAPMEVHISLVGRTRLGAEIYGQLRQAIVDGRLRTGDLLPPTRHLARRLKVSRSTVTGVYERLAGEGFVNARVGAGTFVSDQVARAPTTGKPRRATPALQARAIWEAIPLPTAFARPARFDFRTGLPDVSLFPHKTWHRLIGRELRSGTAEAAGMYGDPAGHPALRTAIARHIGVSRGVLATADDIVITNGTQQALDIIARVLLAPGDLVAVEDPGYTPPRFLFQSHRARVVPVPVDREGLRVEALPRQSRLVYVTPSHQYPLGVPLSLARRMMLLAWAERNNAAIVEDDYDSEFRFEGRPVDPLQTLDIAGRVLYVGSFSKTMLPSLRIGFMVVPPSLRGAAHRAKYVTDWHTSLPIQSALARFIEDGGFARHVRRMSNVYCERRALVIGALSQYFARRLEILPSTNGLHVTALACTASADRIDTVARRAAEVGVAVRALAYLSRNTVAQPGLVFGYGAVPTARVNEGLRRLRSCFETSQR
jgi:GntR family transcriptional regulator / MocR family aminotransferase